jgi:hypothetical protein|tara:strand:- start:350 stop:457 length:108 start_codon:yes stop_codon:yes gene_type:complete
MTGIGKKQFIGADFLPLPLVLSFLQLFPIDENYHA